MPTWPAACKGIIINSAIDIAGEILLIRRESQGQILDDAAWPKLVDGHLCTLIENAAHAYGRILAPG